MARPTIVKAKTAPLALDYVDEFREALKLDKDALDDAVAQQADLYFRVSEAFALALSQRDRAKEHLARVDAETGLEFRKKGESPEAKIKDLVQSSSAHKVAFEEYIALKEKAEILAGLKTAFEDRSHMLRVESQLYNSGYFTTALHKGARNAMQDVQADAGREGMARYRR